MSDDLTDHADLSAAGRRLAATTLRPAPPIDVLRRRADRRRHHRRITGAGILAAAAAVALGVGALAWPGHASTSRVTVGAPAPTEATLPPFAGVPGSSPFDYKRLRLWLPAGWTTSTSSCPTGADQVVTYPAAYQTPCAANPARVATDTITVADYSAGQPSALANSSTTVNGITVYETPVAGGTVEASPASTSATWIVPALGVRLTLWGDAARTVAATLGPSPLAQLLTIHLPAAVPTSWRTVTYGGFQLRVPPTWPTNTITVSTAPGMSSVSGMPNVCAPPLFPSPAIYLGAGYASSCPAFLQTHLAAPDDGVWLFPDTSAGPLSDQSADGVYRLVTLGALQAGISDQGSDVVSVEAQAPDRTRIGIRLGLGVDPAVAEAILSSLTQAPPDSPGPTTTVTPAIAATPTTTADQNVGVEADCNIPGSPLTVKPDHIMLACGDGNAELINLHWTTWTPTLAAATGTYRHNLCRPTCADGKFENVPATTLHLDQPVATAAGVAWSEISYNAPGQPPETLPLATHAY